MVRRNEDYIRNKLDKFIETLIETAMEDNKITEDEQKLIDNIKKGIENLEKQLMQVLQDDLNQDEYEDLESQVMSDIVFNATKVAEKDDIVTEDESRLLKELKEFAKSGVFSDE